MRHVAIITGARAEYGILKPVIEHIEASDSLQGHLLVGGMHLAPEFGCTINQILADGFHIDARIDMLLSSDSRAAMGKGHGGMLR